MYKVVLSDKSSAVCFCASEAPVEFQRQTIAFDIWCLMFWCLVFDVLVYLTEKSLVHLTEKISLYLIVKIALYLIEKMGQIRL